MMNLFYRGYVVHEDIRAICYTIFGCRPHRIELGRSGTVLEAMRWVDRHVARRSAARWLDRDAARRDAIQNRNRDRHRSSQPALL